MAIERQTEIEHLEELENATTRRLRALEKQIAAYGERDAPTHMLVERDDLSNQLRQLQTQRRRLHVDQAYDTPYLGLNTFNEQNAGIFYGREALIAQLVAKVQDQPFLAVLGPSGSGKSSLVLAGLLPKLKHGEIEGSEAWRYLTVRPGARPLDALAGALAVLQGDPTATVRYSTTLSESPRALLLIAEPLLAIHRSTRLVLVVDQFEELWTLAPSEPEARKIFGEQQKLFIDLLLTAAAAPASPLLVILTMRADFLHRAAEHGALARSISERLILVSPMTPDELRSAIERPALAAGGSFEPGLVDELIDQVHGRPGGLPLLEYTLLELWKARRSDGTLTWEEFRARGGVEGALASRADSILDDERYKAPDVRKKLRAILLRLVQPGDGTADTRRRVLLGDVVPAADTTETVRGLLAPLIQARLLTVGHDDRDQATGHNGRDQTTIELSHEALIGGWPTMKRWIEDAREDLRLQLQLGEAAQEWQSSGENAEFLWSQARLDAVGAWRERADSQLTARDARFLEASRAELERRAREREEQRRKEEQLVATQRASWRLRYLRQAVGLALGAGLGYGLGLTYLIAADEAGALLTGSISKRSPGAFFALFFALFLPGAIVGFSIGLALWRWRADQVRKRAATAGVGALAGFIVYAPFVILAQGTKAVTSTSALPHLITGALLGIGLGIGVALVRQKSRRPVVTLLVSALACVLGYMIGGFTQNINILSAAIAGGIIGGLTGLGLYVVAIEEDVSNNT